MKGVSNFQTYWILHKLLSIKCIMYLLLQLISHIKGPFGLVAFQCCGTDDLLAIKSSCVRWPSRPVTIWSIVQFFKFFVVYDNISCKNLPYIFVSTEFYAWWFIEYFAVFRIDLQSVPVFSNYWFYFRKYSIVSK